MQRDAARADRRDRLDGVNRVDRHVLEFEGDDIHLPRERAQRIEIFVFGDDLDVRDLAGGRIRIWRERVHAVAHAPRRNREHPSKLTASQDAERSARRDHLCHGSRS